MAGEEIGERHNYGWVTRPPIVVLESGEASTTALKVYATGLKEDLTAWSVGLPKPLEGPEGKGIPEASTIKNAVTICGMIERTTLDAGKVAFVYPIAGRAVGIMILLPDVSYVADIVVHPGVLFGGVIMMEYALNYLKENGHEEKIDLWALTEEDALLGAYKGMGFRSEDEGDRKRSMTLIPKNAPDKWAPVKGRWKYKSARKMGRKYAATGVKTSSCVIL